MRTLIRFAACTLGLLLVTNVTSSRAAEVNSSASIGSLVKTAYEQLALIRQQLDQASRYINTTSNRTGGYSGSVHDAGGRGQFADLERSTQKLSDVSNDVVRLTAKCGEESHNVAVKFRTLVQRVRSGVSRLESSGSENQAQMTLGKVQHDLDSTEEQLRSVSGLGGTCSV